jgi:superfamily I DNA/RNA helicase
MAFAPTQQQAAFIDFVVNGRGNGVLKARAGTGKTSTIVAAVDAVRKAGNSRDKIILCAFNKHAAVELQNRLTDLGHGFPKTEAKTIHGLGLSLLHDAYGKGAFKIDSSKVAKIVRNQNDPFYACNSALILSFVNKAKIEAFGFLRQIKDRSAWYDLSRHYGLGDALDVEADLDRIIDAAQVVYAASLEDNQNIDFDDMILLPLVLNLTVRYQANLLIVDEAQDLSAARQALLRKFVHPRFGRTILVGDDRQAIYGFAGADVDALPRLTGELNATVLPLTQTFRCGKAIVALAQGIVPDIEAAETNGEGKIDFEKEVPEDWAAGDAILCRNVAPLVDLAYGLIRNGRAAVVLGKDIASGLTRLARKWKINTTAQLRARLETYLERQVQKAIAKDDEAAVERITDTVETLNVIISAVEQRKLNQIDDVVAYIEELFGDEDQSKDISSRAVVLCSYHKSKGAEWDRVALIEHSTRCPSKAARQPWQLRQEDNLSYVAITRAKKNLVFVN